MATRKKKVINKISPAVTPYDNGKVKMGIYYQKPKYVEEDRDMLNLQTYLIGDPVKLKRNYYITRALELFGAIILLIILLQGNP
jgi:hypothetical protein